MTPVSSLLGGVLIGLSAAALLLLQGRLAGVSGIVGGLLPPRQGDASWRILFVAGLVAAGVVAYLVAPGAFGVPDGSPALLIGAGLLVGFGTRLGNGCTSGHGVCGLGRLSLRSLVATCVFVGAGVVTVWAVRHLGGVS